jgi:hypothetical protein
MVTSLLAVEVELFPKSIVGCASYAVPIEDFLGQEATIFSGDIHGHEA